MATTLGFCHIALPVRDPEQSARFYTDLFDMKPLFVSSEDALLSSSGARDLMAFSRSDIEIASTRETFHFGFLVEPDQFDAAVQAIEARSIKKVSEVGSRKAGRYVFIEDPDGYTVEIFEFPGLSDQT